MKTIAMRLLILAAGIAPAAMPSEGCNVPVFRYALERWTPDPFEILLFHRGEAPAAAEALERADMHHGGRGNYVFYAVDLTGPVLDEFKAVWDSLEGAEAPWIAVRPVHAPPGEPPLWSGPAAEAGLELLADSPARAEIARRIVSGESAVWVLLESGDPEKDGAAEAAIRESLEAMERELELPEQTVDPSVSGLRIDFSMIRLSRDDAAEAVLIEQLTRSEPDLEMYAGEPIAFPVFGRGRALYALAGGGINRETIAEACAFVTGACSCQVKELNPGSDLLMCADWASGIPRSLVDEWEMSLMTGAPGETIAAGAVMDGATAAGAAGGPAGGNAAASGLLWAAAGLVLVNAAALAVWGIRKAAVS